MKKKPHVSKEIHIKDLDKQHYLTVKQLRQYLDKIDDDTIVAIHRVEDSYFQKDGENGWKTVKSLWEESIISEDYRKQLEDLISQGKIDPTHYSFEINHKGQTVLKEYIDAIPSFQGYLSTEKDGEKQKIFVITPHY